MVVKVYISGISGNKEVSYLLIYGKFINQQLIIIHLFSILLMTGEEETAKGASNSRFKKC